MVRMVKEFLKSMHDYCCDFFLNILLPVQMQLYEI